MTQELRFTCTGCGLHVAPRDTIPFACPGRAASPAVDHVLRRDMRSMSAEPPSVAAAFADTEPSPFLRFRALLPSFQYALQVGLTETAFADMVESLDNGLQAASGRLLRQTRLERGRSLESELGIAGLWVKNEGDLPGASHKIRHLFGSAVWLRILEATERLPAQPRLAISSCGNAALAGAIAAAALDMPLDVFVPTWADPGIVAQLTALGAHVVVCERGPNQTGDPCYQRFHEAVASGALPFSCQGPDNATCIEGGETLAWEMIASSRRGGCPLDRVTLQVGGGALATSVMRGFEEARHLGVIAVLPRFHTVQASAASPLARAWSLLASELQPAGDSPRRSTPARRLQAETVLREVPVGRLERSLTAAAGRRAQYMWPWETEPRSVADGILDDETYDWLAVVAGMLRTGGYPLEVGEERLVEACAKAATLGEPAPSATGSAGLAGYLELAELGLLDPAENVAVILTGAARGQATDSR